MDWQWESIRDDAFLDVERIIDNFVGDKLAPAERWQLTTTFLDLADKLSRDNATNKIDALGESFRQAIIRFRLKLPRARRRQEPPEGKREPLF
jgi:hypothetical protein